jgi:flagellar biogenesis protein FliO
MDKTLIIFLVGTLIFLVAFIWYVIIQTRKFSEEQEQKKFSQLSDKQKQKEIARMNS